MKKILKENAQSYYDQVLKLILENRKENDVVCHFYGDMFNLEKYHLKDMFHVLPCQMGGRTCLTNTIYCCQNWKYFNTYDNNKVTDNFTDNVISPIFSPDDFTFNINKQNAILYLGRIQQTKGVCEVFKLSKLRKDYTFWIAGQHKDYGKQQLDIDGTIYDLNEYDNVEFFGFADKHLRRKLLSDARCLLQPSLYFEPFGMNVVEAYLSGTPVLTSNYGSFTEIVEHGITGFRSNRCEDFVKYIDRLDEINPYVVLDEGLKYTEEKIYVKYMNYFNNHVKEVPVEKI